MGRIYSVGYERLQVDALAESLRQVGVTVVVDVRLNAVSRRPGFAKKALSAALERVGIEYRHEKELGNPQDNRHHWHGGDPDVGRARMREILCNESAPALERLVELARGACIAVLCKERSDRDCHRQVVTDMVRELDPSIEVVQLL